MSKSVAVPSSPFPEPQKPVLPCPTSPMQQTEGESWEHTRDYGSDYARYTNDHITDRADADSEPDAD